MKAASDVIELSCMDSIIKLALDEISTRRVDEINTNELWKKVVVVLPSSNLPSTELTKDAIFARLYYNPSLRFTANGLRITSTAHSTLEKNYVSLADKTRST